MSNPLFTKLAITPKQNKKPEFDTELDKENMTTCESEVMPANHGMKFSFPIYTGFGASLRQGSSRIQHNSYFRLSQRRIQSPVKHLRWSFFGNSQWLLVTSSFTKSDNRNRKSLIKLVPNRHLNVKNQQQKH